jgi:hypothetical protein
MKNVSLLMLATLVACSDPASVVQPANQPPAPSKSTIKIGPPEVIGDPLNGVSIDIVTTKFNIGDNVMLEGMPEGFTAVIAAVGEVEEWLNQITGETVMQRAYVVVVTNPDGVARPYNVPEVVITAK